MMIGCYSYLFFATLALLMLARTTRSFMVSGLPTLMQSCGNRKTMMSGGASRIPISIDNDKDNATPQEFTVTWKAADGDIIFPAYEGETLRTAALRRGIVSPHNGRARLINCRGLGSCGTCAVEIVEGHVNPVERNDIEGLRLSLPPHNFRGDESPTLRLACQIQVIGDVSVTKRTGFWGQRDSVAQVSEAVTYFGDLEYALDRKSPSLVPTREDNRSK